MIYLEKIITPAEKLINKKFGETGLKFYSLIDGSRNVAEISKQLDLSKTEIIDMLDFMRLKGIIALNYK